EDPDVPAMLERIRKWRDGYLRWGRDTLGFAVYLFYRPGARMG
ncbi:MAG: class I SAM-dependent methyltransferase, partial [Burkholderiales bacterium]|nr:class I SAM-dependent methyltransferase [Burkholderiales bacterium]